MHILMLDRLSVILKHFHLGISVLSCEKNNYWMGKSDNAANCCYYCILHQTIAWEKLLKYCAWLSRSNKMFICWKYNQSLFYVSLYCLVWHSVVFVCSPMKVKPARKQKLEDQTMWKWQWQQSKLSFWPTTSPMIFCCSHACVMSFLCWHLLRWFFGLHWFWPTHLKPEDVVLGKLSPQDKKV